MNPNELYYQNQYTREFDGAVVSVTEENGRFAVVLSQTAFFPEGGGQKADPGTLNGIPVLDVQETAAGIAHYLSSPMTAGETAHGVIDWETRFARMQVHTGEHIVSGLLHRKYGMNNVGFSLTDHFTTLDLDRAISEEELREIETEANRIVWQNLQVITSFPTPEELAATEYRSKKELSGAVRLVSIGDFECCACCAPHVSHTGEIGLIRLYRMIHYKGGMRIEMAAGRYALEAEQASGDAVTEISRLLSVPPESISSGVERLQSEFGQAKARIAGLFRKETERMLAELSEEPSACHLVFSDECDPANQRFFVNGAMEKGRIAGFFTGSEACGFRYIIGSKSLKLRTLSPELNKLLSGTGGGSDQMIQGVFHAPEERIRAVLKEYAACDPEMKKPV